MVDAAFGEVMVTCEKISWLIREGERWLKPEKRSPGVMVTTCPCMHSQHGGVLSTSPCLRRLHPRHHHNTPQAATCPALL